MMTAIATSLMVVLTFGSLALLLWLTKENQPKVNPHSEPLAFRYPVIVRGSAVLMEVLWPVGIVALVILLPPTSGEDRCPGLHSSRTFWRAPSPGT